MLELWQNRTPKSNTPNITLLLLSKRGHTKRLCFNYKLAMIQRNSTTPKPQELSLEGNKKQEKAFNIKHPVNCIIEEGCRLPNTPEVVSVQSDRKPTNVLETQKKPKVINPEISSVLASNHNSEAPPVNPSLELSEMNSNLKKRKIAYGCNHCDIMLLSRNLMNEHLRRKHQTNPKNKNLYQIPLWDYSQSCYLCNQTQSYYMSDASCSPMGNKLCIDCIRQCLEFSDDYLSQYWLNCRKCNKKKTRIRVHSWPIPGSPMLKDTRTFYHRYMWLIATINLSHTTVYPF